MNPNEPVSSPPSSPQLDVENQVSSFLEDRKLQAAAGIHRFADTVAEKIEDAGRYLGENDIEDIAADVATLARRHPVAFVAGSFAAGLLLARFLKSSSRRSRWAEV
jgi:hypothetical protein